MEVQVLISLIRTERSTTIIKDGVNMARLLSEQSVSMILDLCGVQYNDIKCFGNCDAEAVCSSEVARHKAAMTHPADGMTESEIERLTRNIERSLYRAVINMENPRCNGYTSERETVAYALGVAKSVMHDAEYLLSLDKCDFLDNKREQK